MFRGQILGWTFSNEIIGLISAFRIGMKLNCSPIGRESAKTFEGRVENGVDVLNANFSMFRGRIIGWTFSNDIIGLVTAFRNGIKL